MPGNHYRAYIEEVFLKPIRSVLIIDDDYPTFDEILATQADSAGTDNSYGLKTWHQQPERIARVIKRFRNREPSLLVDIHDGDNVEANQELKSVTHLHQCDLLVLDYELDRSRRGDGARAIKILRSVMSNHHFNLVIIYTTKELNQAFYSLLWGLIAPSPDVLSATEVETAEELINLAEDASEGFERQLLDSVTAVQYFHSRQHLASYLRTMVKGQQPYTLFESFIHRAGWNRIQGKLVLRYLLKNLQEDHLPTDLPPGFKDISWSPNGPKWIKSQSAFVALSNKTGDDDLMSELATAITDWSPRPSRLFLTKLRAEMDEFGVAAQNQVLDNHHALAYWYSQLLCANDEQEQRSRIADSVSRHSDQLMATILPRVEEFAMRLIDAEKATDDARAVCKDHFGIDLDKQQTMTRAIMEHNSFICSKDPEGWHLTTGHVFSMCDEYWLCCSPACDMVPAQLPDWRTDVSGETLPFVAVKLREVSAKKIPNGVLSNRFVFLKLNGSVRVYCFNDPSRDNSRPQWHVLYAQNRGKLSGRDLRLSVSEIVHAKTRLVSKRHNANVVAQLRSEYALNLIQKLGVSLTRVGLDFSKGRGGDA